MKELARGAEAIIRIKSNKVLLKDRVSKKYRHPQIDSELIKSRTRKESKILEKLQGLAPKLLKTDNKSKIEMEFIKGKVIKDILDENIFLAKEIGRLTGEIHDKNIVHGDLTTSNIILENAKPSENNKIKIKFIDFGLSITTQKEEDKAVDLHLFKEAVEAKHHKFEKEIWNNFLDGYNPKNKEAILKRLEKVEARGRNKEKY